MPIKINFRYENSLDNREVLRIMYDRIFKIAKKNLIEKRKISKYPLTYKSIQ